MKNKLRNILTLSLVVIVILLAGLSTYKSLHTKKINNTYKERVVTSIIFSNDSLEIDCYSYYSLDSIPRELTKGKKVEIKAEQNEIKVDDKFLKLKYPLLLENGKFFLRDEDYTCLLAYICLSNREVKLFASKDLAEIVKEFCKNSGKIKITGPNFPRYEIYFSQLSSTD